MKRPITNRLGRTCFLLLPALFQLLPLRNGFAFSCRQIGQFIDAYLQMHYSAKDFDDELSRRTLENYLKALDPGKMYFLKEDVERFRSSYATRLDDQIGQSDCGALNAILRVYANRFTQMRPVILGWIEADHDFTVEEFFDTDRKKRDWASSEADLKERWRRRIKYQLLNLRKRYDDPAEVVEKLGKRYALSEKYLSELKPVEVASIFLNAFSNALDPHSTYLSPDDLEDFRISTALSLNGIGAVLRSEYGMTKVQSLVAGGPAEKGGKLKVGDTFLAVAQGEEGPVDVVDMKLREVVKLVRGERGTEVKLTVEREEKGETVQLEIPIIRDKIELKDREAKAYTYEVEVHETPDSPRPYKIGLIELPTFYMDFAGRQNKEENYKSSSADVRRLIGVLREENIDALIMDLRNNSGGSLDEAVNIAGLFFDHGPVVQVRNSDASEQVLADSDDRTYYDGPLVVLINRQSASSSEIFAGAIKDYGRGLIIGDAHSFGKGTVQKVNEVRRGDFGAIKVTISQFFRPSGASTQLRGVASDLVLPDLFDEYKVGEKYYDYVLPWNKIEAADYAHFPLVAQYVDSLRKASGERIASDPDFRKIFDEIEAYREKEGNRTRVSLKEERNEEEDSENEDGDLAEVKAEDDADLSGKSAAEGETLSEKDGEEAASAKESEDLANNDEGSHRPSLEKDVLLRETLAIAADYLQLLNDKDLVAISYPELEGLDISPDGGPKQAAGFSGAAKTQ